MDHFIYIMHSSKTHKITHTHSSLQMPNNGRDIWLYSNFINDSLPFFCFVFFSVHKMRAINFMCSIYYLTYQQTYFINIFVISFLWPLYKKWRWERRRKKTRFETNKNYTWTKKNQYTVIISQYFRWLAMCVHSNNSFEEFIYKWRFVKFSHIVENSWIVRLIKKNKLYYYSTEKTHTLRLTNLQQEQQQQHKSFKITNKIYCP